MHSIVFVIYTAVVTIASLYPGSNENVTNLDKVAHLFVYYIFAVFAYRMLANKKYYLHVCVGIIAYSGLIELVQHYVPGRDMSALDGLANIAGVVLGALVMKRKG